MNKINKILVIDDEKKIRKILQTVLVNEGYDIDVAEDAEQATEILLRKQFDLILLDIKMPEIDGCFMKKIIEDFGHKVKVIVTSVYPIYRQKEFIPNADDYFDKGQDMEILLEKIQMHLSEAADWQKVSSKVS